MARPTPTRGLLVRRPWIDMLLSGEKTWEIRGSATSVRGPVGLCASGTGTVLGVANLIDCVGPLDVPAFVQAHARHRVDVAGVSAIEHLPYGIRTHAWVFETPVLFTEPVSYPHPSGAVIWVRFDRMPPAVMHGIERALAA